MSVGKSLLFSLFILAAPMNLWASPSPKKIRHSLAAQKKKLKSIGSQINSIEDKLESNNHSFINIGKKRETLEERIFTLKRSLLQTMTNLSSKKSELKGYMASLVVNMIDAEDNPANMLANKLLMKQLKGRLSEYKEQMSLTVKMQKDLTRIDSDIQLYKEKEEMVLQAINELEASKRSFAQKYVSTKGRYESYLQKWQDIKVAKSKNSKGSALRARLGTFRSPVDQHKGINFKDEGVTFYFDKKQALRAVRSGKVIHISSLSTYGNVVMIDHGKSTISVCLGDFNPTVKKGQTVKIGQSLGLTKRAQGKKSKVYFEVRQKDKTQPTIHLIEEKYLASTNGKSLKKFSYSSN